MNAPVMQKTVNFIKLAGIFASKATVELAAVETQRAKVAAAVPAVVDHLVVKGAIDGSLRKEAAELLQDHVGVLGLLKDATDKLAAARDEVRELKHKMTSEGGTPIRTGSTKSASIEDHPSLNSPFVGTGRIPRGNRASDQIFSEILHGER